MWRVGLSDQYIHIYMTEQAILDFITENLCVFKCMREYVHWCMHMHILKKGGRGREKLSRNYFSRKYRKWENQTEIEQRISEGFEMWGVFRLPRPSISVGDDKKLWLIINVYLNSLFVYHRHVKAKPVTCKLQGFTKLVFIQTDLQITIYNTGRGWSRGNRTCLSPPTGFLVHYDLMALAGKMSMNCAMLSAQRALRPLLTSLPSGPLAHFFFSSLSSCQRKARLSIGSLMSYFPQTGWIVPTGTG